MSKRLRPFRVVLGFLSFLLCQLNSSIGAEPNREIVIPITKERHYYYHTHENGRGRACGVKLYGSFPVYKNYTNLTSYRVYVPGLQGAPLFSSQPPAPGGRFLFYCYFNGGDGPNSEAPCAYTIGESLPEWWATLQRQPPKASFTSSFTQSVPGEVNFASTSTDPDEEELSFAWTFGDGDTSGSEKPVHRYKLPGNFSASLTVTDTDALTNRATRTIRIPPPPLTVSLRIFSKHEGARIEPGERFTVRATVSAGLFGVGNLSEVKFVGPPLEIPEVLSVVSGPSDPAVGRLAPGDSVPFEWVLKAGDTFGDFILRTSALIGIDAAGRTISSPAAIERGTITALIIGLAQQPKRIVLGEDNNGDGVVDQKDAYLEVVVGVTNVSKIDITDVKTDDVNAPLRLTTRLLGDGVPLEPQLIRSGTFGTIPPGAANPVFRTNLYLATNYLYATAATVLRGDADGTPVQAGADTILEVRNPGAKVTMHALDKSGLTAESIAAGKQSIDAPLIPVASQAVLATQREITGGLVADGVTPLLLAIQADAQALEIQGGEWKIRVVTRIKSGGTLKNTALQDRVRLLNEGVWSSSATTLLKRGEDIGYLYVPGIPSDDLELAAGSTWLKAELVVEDADTGRAVEAFEFTIRRPPVFLVHGYNTGGDWGAEFGRILEASRGIEASRGSSFVQTIKYGQDIIPSGGNSVFRNPFVEALEALRVNTLWPLEDLAPILWQEMDRKRDLFTRDWALTRFDVVAHSQGGVLSRMLATQNSNTTMKQPFRNESNHYRGRFQRVITIGSPHNGTRILRYILALDQASRVSSAIPPLLGMMSVSLEISQQKFDPWGEQIRLINQPDSGAPWYPDPGAKFHLVRTTVNGGEPPNPGHASLADHGLGLSTAGTGPIVVPAGSDGIVDAGAQEATASTQQRPPNVYGVPPANLISHAALGDPDIFGGVEGQVYSVLVAKHAIAALDQDPTVPATDRVFGAFRLPTLLPNEVRERIDEAARNAELPQVDAVLKLVEFSGAGALAPAANPGRRFTLQLTPTAAAPLGIGGVKWTTEEYGTNLVPSGKVTLTPNVVDPTRATVTVAPDFLGDVVAYAGYFSLSNSVLATPLKVTSFEPNSAAVELRVLPQGMLLPAGSTVPIELLVAYADGTIMRRYADDSELTVSSSAPTIVDVSDPLRWNCRSAGIALVTTIWHGLTNSSEVSVFADSARGLPIPHPLVWLRSDKGVSTDGTNVTAWTDQSGNGFVFTAPSLTGRPSYVPALDLAGTNVEPAVRFNGAARQTLRGNLDRTLSGATVFAICRFTGTGSPYIYAFGTRNYSGMMMTLARRSGTGAYHYDGAAEQVAPNTIAGTNFFVFSQVYGGDGPDHHRLYRNGEVVLDTRTTTGRAYSAVATNVVIGNYLAGSSYFTGDLVEWIVYDRTLSSAERAQVEEYLRLRTGLAPFPAEDNIQVSGVNFALGYSSTLPRTTWTFDTTNGVVRAQGGQPPSVHLLDEATASQELHTQLVADGTTGALGVVFGYEGRNSFHLLSWRATAETNALGELAPAGLRLVSFHPPEEVEAPNAADFWTSADPASTTVWRTNDLAWVPGQIYDVTLRPGTNGLVVQLDQGTTNLVTWTVPELGGPIGWFGHFSHGVASAEFGPATVSEQSSSEPLVISEIQSTGTGQWIIRWTGGSGPFTLERSDDLSRDVWIPVGQPSNETSRTVTPDGETVVFRIRAGNP